MSTGTVSTPGFVKSSHTMLVLFPSNLLSSSNDSLPGHNLAGTDTMESTVSPTIHKGIEHLLPPNFSAQTNENDRINSIRKFVNDIDLTTITPSVSSRKSIYSTPLVEIDKEDVNSSTYSISKSSFYGSTSNLVTKKYNKSRSLKLFSGVKRPNSNVSMKDARVKKQRKGTAKGRQRNLDRVKLSDDVYDILTLSDAKHNLNDVFDIKLFQFFKKTVHQDNTNNKTYEYNSSPSNKKRSYYEGNDDKHGFGSAAALLEFLENGTNDDFQDEQSGKVTDIMKNLEALRLDSSKDRVSIFFN